MTPDEISDHDSLKEWLEGQTREVAITIAHRAAMRVAPHVWLRSRPVETGKSETAIAALRGLVVSHLACVSLTPAIQRAAKAALGPYRFSPFDISSETTAHHANAVCRAAMACVYGPLPAARDSFESAFRHYNYISTSLGQFRYDGAASHDGKRSYGAPSKTQESELFQTSRTDAEALGAEANKSNVATYALWRAQKNPFSRKWTHVKSAWAATAEPGWQFWIDWYDAALAGRPLLGDWDRHWKLLEEIALIAPDKWDAGPDTVNPLIAGIWESHQKLGAVLDATPNGEDLLLTVEDGKIAAVPHADIGDDLRSHILRSVEKALERFFAATSQTGNSNFGPVLRDCAAQDLEYLREDVKENQAYDVGLHDAIDECLGALRRKFAEQGLSDDPAALRLTTVLERCTVDIYANSEAAREVLEKRADELYRRISLEHSLQLNQLVHDMAADSVAPLARALLADLQRADDETADPDLRRRSRYRTISRLPRGARAVRYSRFEDGKRVVEDRPQPLRDRLWVATVLGPPGAVLLQHLLSL